VLKDQGKGIYLFDNSHTDFGEEIEFNYAKLTCLVMYSFSLEPAAKERKVNLYQQMQPTVLKIDALNPPH
jgi:hypothetical protein